MSDIQRRFHEAWLGMVQPVEGLVFSVPALVEAQCMRRATPDEHAAFRNWLSGESGGESGDPSSNGPKSSVPPPPATKEIAGDFRGVQGQTPLPGAGRARNDAPPCSPKLPPLLQDVLGFRHILEGEEIDEALQLWVPEGQQSIRPTHAIAWPTRLDGLSNTRALSATPTDAEHAAQPYATVVCSLPYGLDFDKPETVTGEWNYPPAAKFDRLLRHARLPFGLLFNGVALRLVVAPHGESSGALTFRLGEAAETGGREILSGLVSVLSSTVVLGPPERNLDWLLRESRRRQADVTNALAGQVFEAIDVLLQGFAAAAERDGTGAFREALERDDEHVYRGLLTSLLRLVFLLYAEDRALMPTSHPLYAEHLSVLGLWEQLQADAGAHPDQMHLRYGAWPRLLALFRGVYDGMRFGELHTPPRHGTLFDPELYPFLEGRGLSGDAPRLLGERAMVATPTVDDGTVHGVLRRLLMLGGQRLSYQALDVEQIGSVYERLMGYHVERLTSDAVCMKPDGVWLTDDTLLDVPPAQRAKWLKTEIGLSTAVAKRVATAYNKAAPPTKASSTSANPQDLQNSGGSRERSSLAGPGAAPQSERSSLAGPGAAPQSERSSLAGPGAAPQSERIEALQTQRYKRTAPAAAGRYVLQPGSERRRTSSHYTPRSLTSRMVKRAFDPVFLAMGEQRTSSALLALKVCDPAMGSGAFLVEACRALADEVVAAWTREGTLAEIAATHGDPVVHARRLVAQRCLYGVDKNAFAVDLAKLSLWLVTLAADEPFTFVDHALRHGDSLVGLDLAQIRSLSWKPTQQQVLVQRALDDAVSLAVALRREILALAESGDPRDVQRKTHLLHDADDALRRARLIADLVVAAFFAGGSAKERKTLLAVRQDAIVAWLSADTAAPAALLLARETLRAEVPAFHWMLEFPEVFSGERPDPLAGGQEGAAAWFDVFVGNPPFLGGSGVSSNFGNGYRDWLPTIHKGAHGNADLCAHFFLRAAHYLGENGSLGLIATNTIGQGDTRATGLQRLLSSGAKLYDAVNSMPWPGEAGVTISTVHLALGSCAKVPVSRMFGGELVTHINSRLRPRPERPDPVRLQSNARWSFRGSMVYGQGFTLTLEERDVLVANDSRNAERIFPYLGGAEVNRSPTQDFDRYVINFGDMSLEEAERWPDLIDRVRRLVKPERDKLKNNPDGRRRQQYWWQFGRETPALNRAIAPLDRCLVTSRVSKHAMFSFQPTDRVFSEQLYVFPLESSSSFGVIQSRVHVPWAWLLSSSMKTDLRYSASDCFETFPFPDATHMTADSTLEQVAAALYDERAAYMLGKQVGLTDTYNRLTDSANSDPAIVALRDLHLDLDRAVLAAYGWQDIEVPPFETPTTDEGRAALQAFEDEVIDRLFALNAERAEQERLLAASTSVGGKKGKPTGKGGKNSSKQGKLI